MKNQKIICVSLFAIIIFLGSSCVNGNECKHLSAPKWTLVFKNSKEGESLFGYKKDLIHALRAGSPLRIGFGGRNGKDTLKTIEHITNAQFVNIANGNEVFAQIETMNRQRLDLKEEPLSMGFRKDKKLSMIVCTNGKLSTLFIDHMADTIRTTKTNTRGFSWFVLKSNCSPDNDKKMRSPPVEPLWD